MLKRVLTFYILTFYGLGTILGAGIYALIGEVGKIANQYTPIAFLVAAIIAAFTAISYAELCSRYPYTAGSALYIQKAFNKHWLSGIMGWLIVLTGLVSAATLSHGFFNYFHLFVPISFYLTIFILLILLGGVAAWGISESAMMILIMTVLEISGLLLIIFYGKSSFSQFELNDFNPGVQLNNWLAIFSGAFIAFYAFIGFEDMVNVAEETVRPEKTIPYAILCSLFFATILYLLVAFVTIKMISPEILNNTKVPLDYIIKSQGHSSLFFNLIALFAIMNGILVQIIMASRLIFGMARQKNAPKIFLKVYSKTQTPLLATILVVIAIIIFAYWLPIQTLAKTTSFIMLIIFTAIHISLIVIKRRKHEVKSAISFPIIFPIIGMLLSLAFIGIQIVSLFY